MRESKSKFSEDFVEADNARFFVTFNEGRGRPVNEQTDPSNWLPKGIIEDIPKGVNLEVSVSCRLLLL